MALERFLEVHELLGLAVLRAEAEYRNGLIDLEGDYSDRSDAQLHRFALFQQRDCTQVDVVE